VSIPWQASRPPHMLPNGSTASAVCCLAGRPVPYVDPHPRPLPLPTTQLERADEHHAVSVIDQGDLRWDNTSSSTRRSRRANHGCHCSRTPTAVPRLSGTHELRIDARRAPRSRGRRRAAVTGRRLAADGQVSASVGLRQRCRSRARSGGPRLSPAGVCPHSISATPWPSSHGPRHAPACRLVPCAARSADQDAGRAVLHNASLLRAMAVLQHMPPTARRRQNWTT